MNRTDRMENQRRAANRNTPEALWDPERAAAFKEAHERNPMKYREIIQVRWKEAGGRE